MSTLRPPLASELHAITQGALCVGDAECHYCTAPCDRTWIHDDAPPIPFTRSTTTALRPGNLYVCAGCWLYRRGSVTVTYLRGGFRDRQKLRDYGWWMTEDGVWVVTKQDHEALYRLLLSPPLRFALALRSEGGPHTLLQLARVNDHSEIHADTPLVFTLDNQPLTYTVYELEQGLRFGTDGKMPGVRALVGMLGPHLLPPLEEVKPKRGRPFRAESVPENTSHKRVRASGVPS